MTNESKIDYLLISGFGIGVLFITFFLTRNKFKKRISFSRINEINYIPNNDQLLDYKNDLYYSSDDLKNFSYNARNNYDWDNDNIMII